MIQTIVLAPDKTRLAYFKGTPENFSLYSMPVDGSQQPHLLRENMRCSEPYMSLVWSHDGKYLYFAQDDNNWFHDLWQIDPKTKETTQLTDYFHTNSYPVIAHPNGDQLLIISNLRGELNVRLFDIKTRNLRKITDYASPVKTAVYSPHGTEIAYTANATVNPHNSDIYIMNADGFNKRNTLSTLAGAFDIVRDWCPNGRYLAIDSNFEGGWRAGVFDLRIATLKWFTPAWDVARCLSFSPDGKHLLIYTVSGVQAFNVTTLTSKLVHVGEQQTRRAIWLDNEQLIVATDRDELHRVNLESGTTTTLHW